MFPTPKPSWNSRNSHPETLGIPVIFPGNFFISEFPNFRAVEHPGIPEDPEHVRVRSYESHMVIRPHRGFDEVGTGKKPGKSQKSWGLGEVPEVGLGKGGGKRKKLGKKNSRNGKKRRNWGKKPLKSGARKAKNWGKKMGKF